MSSRLTVAQSTQHRQTQLKEVVAIFFTTDDDKDDDTVLSIYVSQLGGVLAAKKEGVRGYYTDGSVNNIALETLRNLTYEDLNGGTATIRISPNGHDTWRFSFELLLRFADGTENRRRFGNLELNEKSHEATLQLNQTK
jgi:hypothetical protein